MLFTLPVFCTRHAHFILSIFQDIFGDIEGDGEIISMLNSVMPGFDEIKDSELLENHFDSSDSDSDNLEVSLNI